LIEEALEFSRIAGDTWGTGCCLCDLAFSAAEDGEYARARDLYLQALAAFQTIGDRKLIASMLERLAGIALECGDPAHAVRLLAVTAALRSQIGLPPYTDTYHRDYFSQYSARARSHLSESEWTQAWVAGVAMTQEQGSDFALSADLAL
jgi:hypothetical protein